MAGSVPDCAPGRGVASSTGDRWGRSEDARGRAVVRCPCNPPPADEVGAERFGAGNNVLEVAERVKDVRAGDDTAM